MIYRRLKQLAEKYLPRPVVKLARRTSRGLAEARLRRSTERLRASHRGRNVGLGPDELRLRNGQVLKVTREARETHEYFCFKDPSIVQEFDAFVTLMEGKHRFLDIGAEHGLYSLTFAASQADRSAVAVEPSPAAYPILIDQLRINPSAAIRPLNLALGESNGEIEMAVRGSHAVTAFGSYSDLEESRIRVPIRTVDDLCQELDFAPDLLKIDVEGYELFVLNGARDILARDGPDLLLEIHPQMMTALGHSPAQLIDFLASAGYVPVNPGSGKTYRLHVDPAAAHVLRTVFKRVGENSN